MRTLNMALKEAAKHEPLLSGFSGLYLFLPKLLGRDAGLLTWLALLNAAWCICFSKSQRIRYLVTFSATYVVLALLCFYIRETARLPARLTYNMPLFLNAICLYWASRMPRDSESGAPSNFLIACLAALRRAGLMRLPLGALLPFWVVAYAYILSEINQNLLYRDACQRSLKMVSQKMPAAIRGLSAGTKFPTIILLPFNSILEQSPFFLPPQSQPRCALVPYGWLTHSPIFKQILQERSLEPYSTSILNRDDVFLLMDGARWIKPLQAFYKDHYSMTVWFDLVLDTDDNSEFRDCQLQLYKARIMER
jgi:hypothetical protein